MLVPRLSQQANTELIEVQELLGNTERLQQPDTRSSKFTGPVNIIQTSAVYRAATITGTASNIYSFVWKATRRHGYDSLAGFCCVNASSAASAYTRSMSLTQTPVNSVAMQLRHVTIIFHCSVVAQFWQHIGWGDLAVPEVSRLWEMPRPPAIRPKYFSTIILLCCWQIWNHRHDVVFRHLQPSLPRLLCACQESSRLWGCRLHASERHIVKTWCQMFVMN